MECECISECCDADDDMVKQKDTPMIRKIIAGILLIGTAVCLAFIGLYNYKYARKLMPYYLKTSPAMYIPIFAIATAGFSALGIVVFLFYFFVRFCCGKCSCFWYLFNMMVSFAIGTGIVTYALGIQKDIDKDNYKYSEYIAKCSKGISDCYNGYYNKTLGKMNGYDKERDRRLLKLWDEFYIWYMDLLSNYDDICGKRLDTTFALELICFVLYSLLVFVMGGCSWIREKFCCCCCCCNGCCKNWFGSKDKSSDENDVDDVIENEDKKQNKDLSAPNHNSKDVSEEEDEPNEYAANYV